MSESAAQSQRNGEDLKSIFGLSFGSNMLSSPAPFVTANRINQDQHRNYD
jgi:hypothetical protein